MENSYFVSDEDRLRPRKWKPSGAVKSYIHRICKKCLRPLNQQLKIYVHRKKIDSR